MKIISYWKDTRVVFVDEGLTFITGYYDYNNENNGGVKSLGIHWENYPNSRGVLSPCVIPKNTRNTILSGLLYRAVATGDKTDIASLTEAIDFFNEEK